MTWFWLTMVYLVFLVSAEVINKKSLNNLKIDAVIFGAFVQLATAIFGFGIALSTGWKFHFDTTSIALSVGMAITYFCAISLYFTGLKKVDLSLASIFGSVGSMFSLILGTILLHESFGLSKLAGITLIIVANCLLFFKSSSTKMNKYVLIIITSTFFYALGAIFDKKLNTYGNAISYLSLSFSFAGIGLLLGHYKRFLQAFSGSFKNKAFWYGITTNGLLYSLGFWALFTAYSDGGEVSRMYPITMSTAIIIPIAGILFLGERKAIMRKVAAAAIALLGLWVLGR